MRRNAVSLVVSAAMLGIAAGPAVAEPDQGDKRPTGETYEQILARLGDGMRENIIIRGEHDARTDARKHKRFYTDLQPLADLPPYRPARQLAGTIRVSGLYLHDGLIKDQWIAAFQRFHPDVRVEILPKGSIASGAVDIETGPRISDRLRAASQYERATGERLFEIDWATGSYDVPGWSPGFVIFVHKDNPIAQLSVQQLDGIFAGARTGGWKGTTWDPSAARGADRNIRTWGQLGLTGEWADKPIVIHGRPLKYNIQLGFERKIFQGGDVWNENTLEYSHEANPDGTRYSSSVEMVKDLVADRYGISFSDMGSNRPGVRAVPIGATANGPFVPISLASLRDRSYPLFIEQWAQVRLAPGKRLDPLVKEFLTFMLSRDGQDAVQRDGKWIVLPAARAAEMRARLDAVGQRSDPRALGLQLDQLAPQKWDGESPDETGRSDAARAYYPGQPFDLAGLPAYAPAASTSGTIRLPASGQFMAGNAGKALIAAFRRHHPQIRFDLKDGDLIKGEVDLSVGRKWSSYFAGEIYDFQMKHERSPREFQIATGSFDVPGWSPALAVFVGRDNPVAGLTIEQLDGIFGGPRRGGWVSTTWRRQAGRGADGNIRWWRDLGIGGACADQPITVYVPPLKYHLMSVFERKVLKGGNMWNDAAREIPLALRQGKRTRPGTDRVAAVARDRCAITFADPGVQIRGARMVPVARTASGPFVLPTLHSVQDRSYPLHLETYAYADAPPGQPIAEPVREFLRFMLSRDGQAIIQRDGKWLPLTAPVAQAEAGRIDATIPQVTTK